MYGLALGATNGNSYWMATPSFNLSESRQASVFFDVAAGSVNPGTTLYVLASTNQGETYKVIWSEAGSALSTVSTGNANPSSAGDYERKYVNLTEYAGEGKKEIRLAFALDVFGTQNAPVYLDNLELFLSANPDPVIPAERNTHYKMLKKFETENESEEGLDKIKDYSQFGSYAELIKINKFRYKNPREQ